jgi:hypothetical protein
LRSLIPRVVAAALFALATTSACKSSSTTTTSPVAARPPVAPITADSAPAASASSSAPATPCPPPRSWPAVVLPDAAPRPAPGTEPDVAALARASDPLRAACRRIEALNKQRRASVYGHGPGPFADEDRARIANAKNLGCFAFAQGAWTIEFDAFHAAKEGGQDASWRLVHLGLDGRRAGRGDAGGVDEDMDGEGHTTTDVFAAWDFDGDGVGEVLLVTASYWSIDGVPHSGNDGFRLHGGTIVSWDPVPGSSIVDLADVDGDGRPDLVLDGRPGVVTIAHSLPGGRFSTDDDVARAVLRASCARPVPPAPNGPTIYPPPPSPESVEKGRAPLCASVADPPPCPSARP